MKRRTGSWLVNYDFFDQYLVLSPLDLTKGWGIFASICLADQATNPVRWSLNPRVGGERPLPSRSADSFGVGLCHIWNVPFLAADSVPKDQKAECQVQPQMTMIMWRN
jgi:hypothetical protein